MPVLILANTNITKCPSRIFCSCSYKNFWTSGGTIVCPSERPECCEAKYRLFFYYILPFADLLQRAWCHFKKLFAVR